MGIRFLAAILLCHLCLTLSGCARSVDILQPTNGSQVNLPAQVEVRVRGFNFSAQLDGQTITNAFTPSGNLMVATLDAATYSGLTPGSVHTLHAYADLAQQAWQVRDLDDDVSFSITPLPPTPRLSFSPTQLNVDINTTATATVSIPTNAPASLNVTLTPSTPNVNINGQGAGNPAMVTISAGTRSQPFSVQAAAVGPSNITATAMGFLSAGLAVIVPTPTFNLSVSPSSSEIQWGQTGSYTVTIDALNGFTGMVDLSAMQVPTGTTPTFSPTQLNFTGQSSLNSTLTVGTVEAGADPGQHTLPVRAVSGNESDTENATLIIRRTEGAFVKVPLPLRFQNHDCTPGIRAVVSGSPNNYSVRFETPQGNTSNIASPPLYAFSQGCRIGLVIPPAGTYLRTLFYNLHFPPSTGAVAITNLIENVQFNWQQYYFSPDQSVVAIWGASGSQTGPAQRVMVYDLVEDQQIGSPQGFTSANPTGISISLNSPSAASNANMIVFSYNRPNGTVQQITWPAP